MIQSSVSPCPLNSWYQNPTGQLLLQEMRDELLPYINVYPQKTILQLGCLDLLKNLLNRRAPRRFTLCKPMTSSHDSVSAWSDYYQLPIRDACIDLVIVAHLFESETNIQTILAECWRVLSANGQLIIVGINPWSLWGLTRVLSSPRLPSPPFQHLTSAQKIRRYIRYLDGELVLSKTFCYQLPSNKKRNIRNLRWLEKFGQLTLPYGGGLYLIIAKKRIISPILIKPRWSLEQIFAPKGFSEPTAGGVRNG